MVRVVSAVPTVHRREGGSARVECRDVVRRDQSRGAEPSGARVWICRLNKYKIQNARGKRETSWCSSALETSIDVRTSILQAAHPRGSR